MILLCRVAGGPACGFHVEGEQRVYRSCAEFAPHDRSAVGLSFPILHQPCRAVHDSHREGRSTEGLQVGLDQLDVVDPDGSGSVDYEIQQHIVGILAAFEEEYRPHGSPIS